MREVLNMAQTVSELDRMSFEEQTSKQAPRKRRFGSTPRTATLREALKWKASVIKDFEDVISGLGKCQFRASVRIDVNRARIFTESYRQSDGQPWVIRQAKASALLCEKMPIFIKAGELIVGDCNGAPEELRWHPEIDSHYMVDAVTTGSFSEMVTDAERKEIVSNICEFWDGRSLADRIKAILPKEECQDVLQGFPSPIEAKMWEQGPVSVAYEFPVLFKQGVQARIETAKRKLKELNQRGAGMPPAEYLEKKTNWEAMIIAGKGLLRFAQRYAELARSLAAEEVDDTRKQELEEIVATLDQVPARPARNFREALQFYWMIEIAAPLHAGVRARLRLPLRPDFLALL